MNQEGKPVVGKPPKESRRWTLYKDGASSREGSGSGIMLTIPKGGGEVTYALRFDFHTSDNEVEYKALLTGLRLDKKMGVEAAVP